MTLGLDNDGLERLLCGVIWFAITMTVFIEVFALLGWIFGEAERGGWIGATLNCLFWCRLLYRRGGNRQ